MSARKQEIRRFADASAPARRKWLARGAFFHDEDLLYLKFLIPKGARVLELGCGAGDTLAALKPSFGVGVDFTAGMIGEARKAHPDLTFLVGDIENPAFVRSLPGPFDVIVVIDTLGTLDDCQAMFASLHDLCTRETRLVVGCFSHLWYPALKLAEAVELKMPQPPQSVLSAADVRALAALGDFDAVKNETRVLVPLRLFGLGRLVNRFLAPLPLIRQLCLRHFTVCRSGGDGGEVREHRHSRAQRARQYRGGGQAHPALRRAARNHLRRGPF
jgi:SAM-dependent methyltransferase